MSAFHCSAALVKSLSLACVDVMTVRKNIHHKRSGEWTIFFASLPLTWFRLNTVIGMRAGRFS